MSPFHVWYTSLYLSNKRSETKNLILRANRYIVQNKKSNKTMFLSVFTEILSVLNLLLADKHFLKLRNLCQIEFLYFCRLIRNNFSFQIIVFKYIFWLPKEHFDLVISSHITCPLWNIICWLCLCVPAEMNSCLALFLCDWYLTPNFSYLYHFISLHHNTCLFIRSS